MANKNIKTNTAKSLELKSDWRRVVPFPKRRNGLLSRRRVLIPHKPTYSLKMTRSLDIKRNPPPLAANCLRQLARHRLLLLLAPTFLLSIDCGVGKHHYSVLVYRPYNEVPVSVPIYVDSTTGPNLSTIRMRSGSVGVPSLFGLMQGSYLEAGPVAEP